MHRNCFAGKAADFGIDPALAGPALELFDEALELAETDEVRKRVEKASIAAYRLAIDPVWSVSDPASVDQHLLKRMRPLIERFLAQIQHAADVRGAALRGGGAFHRRPNGGRAR